MFGSLSPTSAPAGLGDSGAGRNLQEQDKAEKPEARPGHQKRSKAE